MAVNNHDQSLFTPLLISVSVHRNSPSLNWVVPHHLHNVMEALQKDSLKWKNSSIYLSGGQNGIKRKHFIETDFLSIISTKIR